MRNAVWMFVLLVLTVCLLVSNSILDKEVEIALEAELAQKIQEPMKIDDSDKGKGASNGKFIWMERKLKARGGGQSGPNF